VFFDLDGNHVWYGGFDKEARLARARLRAGPAAQVTLPPLGDDAVAYIAQNPKKRDEYAVATFKRSVYLSIDNGASWKQIADGGKAK